MGTFTDQNFRQLCDAVKRFYTDPEHVTAIWGRETPSHHIEGAVIAEIHSRMEEFIGERLEVRDRIRSEQIPPESPGESHTRRRREEIILFMRKHRSDELSHPDAILDQTIRAVVENWQDRLTAGVTAGSRRPPPFMARSEIVRIVSDAIQKRRILLVRYQHTVRGDIIQHRIAPFDIGSSNLNPKVRERNADKFYAYSFTHRNEKDLPDPRVCGFDINHFLEILPTTEVFDEKQLTILNLQSTKYDYRTCRFALLPDRDWYQRAAFTRN